MSIEIVIPNYNGLSLMEKNLPSLLNAVSSYPNISVTLVDDGSGKEEKKKLYKYIAELKVKYNISIKLLENEKNKGFSSAVNKGAYNSKADLVIFLNTDISVEKGFAQQAVKDINENEKLFGVGFMDESLEDGKTILRGRGIGRWEKGFLIHKRGEVNKNNTLWISGGSSIVRTELFKKLGGLDEIYNPFYWEDIDLSYRALKSGYLLMFENRSSVIHKHFEGAIKKYYTESEIKTVAYRNQFIFVWKNITDTEYIISHILWLPYHFFKALLRKDIFFFLGFLLALKYFPVIIFKRLKQKKFYSKKDKEILDVFKNEK